MSNEDHDDRRGGWEPTPQGGEYDAEATAFVHLPPEDLANVPLAAPGQGYVPPMILPLTPAAGLDPAATGSWVVQTPNQQDQQDQQNQQGPDPQDQHDRHGLPDGQEPGAEPAPAAVHWPDPNQQQTPYGYPQPGPQGAQEYPDQAYPDQYPGTAAATGQWNFTESGGPAEAAGHTGQWTIPVADGELPEESGEFSASALAAGWYADRTPPATLPGGASAPWATQEPHPGAGDTPALGTDLGPPPEPAAEAPADDPADETGTDPAADGAEAGSPDAPDADAPDAAAGPEDARQAAGPEQPGAAAPDEALPDDAAPDDAVVDAPPAPALDLPSEHPATSYVLHVNGADRPVTDAWIGESLLYVLRERLGLAGAKDGCSQGECGACNVQVDGRLVASCLVPAATAAGSEVRTVEGLAVDGEPSDVQRALAECGAVQCGFCIPGMAMTVHDLLEGNHAPSELETRQALCGNLCRCSGYRGVLDAVNEVIAGREAASEAAAAPARESAEADEARIPHQAAPGAGSVQAHLQDGGMA
ncbi:2Fe-2S iron-sulfur cluster-binding protein [Streptomyces sp. NBC_00385]|uniref:2Fe-2S iron-sulfur cluster-binding protein n=1 Tax=Streptomyces sp. NBC_00385 TaxID=2975733 RepID=UPI002DD83A9B|nr:2Fe-2S iron-sulfur cluster-binding protein [Streptomyces sp. NBC_00385]WRZ06255.1 2Fe-2S iron-sulfur cluster-binding protein [Streptomyces sp. NBC_00385]